MELNIALETVCRIILRAREFDALVPDSDPDEGSNASDDGSVDALEDDGDNPVEEELRAAIDDLADDEAIELVALALVGRPSVLLLDEYPSVLGWARTALQDGGCTVYTAVSVDEALTLAASLRAAGTPLHMILCDSDLQHVDGEMIGMLLRFDDPGLPLVQLGGASPSAGAAPSSSEGVMSVLAKPLAPRALLDCVLRTRREDIPSEATAC